MKTTQKTWRDRKGVALISNVYKKMSEEFCHKSNQIMPGKEKIMIDL